MNKIFISLIVLFSSLYSLAQKNDFVLADSLMGIGKVQDAIDKYRKFNISQNTIHPSFELSFAEALSYNNQIDSAFYHLKIAIIKDSTYTVLRNPFFYNLISDYRWNELVDEQLKKYQAKNGLFKDYEYAKKLISLRQKDQLYYYEVYMSIKVNGSDSPITQSIWELKNKINQELLLELEVLIRQNGYPKCSDNLPCATPFLIIQHSDLKTQEKYLPLIKEMCMNKEIPCNQYAMLQDRVNLRNNKSQIYGTQGPKDENGMLPNLYEPEKINERRIQLGLNPLNY